MIFPLKNLVPAALWVGEELLAPWDSMDHVCSIYESMSCFSDHISYIIIYKYHILFVLYTEYTMYCHMIYIYILIYYMYLYSIFSGQCFSDHEWFSGPFPWNVGFCRAENGWKKNRFLLQQTVERLQVNTFHLKIGHSMPIENIVRAFWGVLLSSQGETCGSWTSEIPSARIPLIYQGCAEDQGAVQVVYI